MRSYYRIMLGRKSVNAGECLAGGFIGTDFGIHEDLTSKLPENWRDFNQTFIPIFLATRPDKTKVAAGRARISCGLKSAHCPLNKRKRLKEQLRWGTRGCATKNELRRRNGAHGIAPESFLIAGLSGDPAMMSLTISARFTAHGAV